MKVHITCIFILSTFFTPPVSAQSFIALSTGISTDISNKKPFYAIPLTLRWEPFKRSAFFIEAIQGIVFKRVTNAEAYTVNQQLPAHVVLKEKVSLSTFSVGIGGAIVLYTNKKYKQFTLNVSLGVSNENFTVSYKNYDKINYEVLNPDVNKKFSGLYGAIAPVYNFHKKNPDMFIMLRVQSPALAGVGDRYDLSYTQTAPLQLTFGYKIFY